MRLILTHEQADFDAVASLAAAALLDSEALAALPRKLNRNVRAFLTLYGDRLPFVEHRDLPRRRVDRMTIVDTQSPLSVKGFSDRTKVHVVDHHPRSSSLEPSWTTHIELVGATTTLLVEALQETEVEPDLVTATLMLLGIYEDTGSLSYVGTTPRDVRACAWLLEWGASLEIASDFLNHPLSPEQRRVYERLIEGAETYRFHGLPVMIASASAAKMVDEVSTLAHKLRDVFDPAGLFVLVALDGNVQMVARSTSDSLDVSRVAEHFGGGGHNRAAAALIRDRSVEQVQAELLEILPQVVEPLKTVGEIMSRGPQVLTPDVSVAEAAGRMQRFGHEGYPVVERGRVIGLLTRRAVDRALSHDMGDRPVSTVMNAGELVVHPEDSVHLLQRVMIENNWGQVPVADPRTGKIVGIVTRTDLLKTLAQGEIGAPAPRLADRLEAALPPARLALIKLVAHEAERAGVALYIVGGFVRDLYLGAPSVDFDLVVEGDAIAVVRALAREYGGRVSSHRRFGTAKWHLDSSHQGLRRALGAGSLRERDLPESLDFVSARTEFYTQPTALPSVARGGIKLDLHRRDFSVNTLALRLDGRFYGQLLDHWGGGRDLREGFIRVLHSLSFVDDPTRMLRAVRLEQRLGFKIEPRTLELLHQALPLLDKVSGERIRNELTQIFNEGRLKQIMSRLSELGLLKAIHPALGWDGWLEARFELARAFEPPGSWRLQARPSTELLLYALWLYRLPVEVAQAICTRLRLPKSLREAVLEAGRLGCELTSWSESIRPSEVVVCLEGRRAEALVATWLALLDQPDARDAIERYIVEWREVLPIADGNTLRSLGLPAGPIYRQILWDLRAAWLDGQVSSAEEERGLLQDLVEEVMRRE